MVSLKKYAMWILLAATALAVAGYAFYRGFLQPPRLRPEGAMGRMGYVYAVSQTSNDIYAVDIANLQVVGRVKVGRTAHNVWVSPGGRWLATTNYGEGTVSLINRAALEAVAPIRAGKWPTHVIFSPDERYAFVPDAVGYLRVLDLQARSQVAELKIAYGPHGLFHPAANPGSNPGAGAGSKDGLLAIAGTENNRVSLIDVTTPTQPRLETEIVISGQTPIGATFSPDGRWVATGNAGTSTVSIIDVSLRREIAHIPVGLTPIQVAFSPDGRWLASANSKGSSVTLIETSAWRPVTEIPIRIGDLGPTEVGAHGLAWTKDSRSLFVTNTGSNSISLIDAARRAVVAHVGVGNQPQGITVWEPEVSPPRPVVEYTVVARRWDFVDENGKAFEPTVNLGDLVVIRLRSPDTAHGLALNDFKVIQTIAPGKEEMVAFVAATPGTLKFYCYIYCGPGHFPMERSLTVQGRI